MKIFVLILAILVGFCRMHDSSDETTKECHLSQQRAPLLSSAWSPSQSNVKTIDVSNWEGSNKFCVVIDNVLTPEESRNLIELSERKGYDQALVNMGNRQVLMTDTRNNDRCIHDDPQLVEEIWQRVLLATAEKDANVHQSLVNVPWINERNQRRNTGKTFQAVGLNERMRFLKYDPGTFFAPHYDGSYVRSREAGVDRAGEQSFVTFQLYLNEGFEGGFTRFVPPDEDFDDEVGEEEEEEVEVEVEAKAVVEKSSWFSFFTMPKREEARKKKFKRGGYKFIPRTGSVLLFQHDCLHEGARVREGRKYAVRTDVMYTAQGPGLEYSKKPIVVNKLGD